MLYINSIILIFFFTKFSIDYFNGRNISFKNLFYFGFLYYYTIPFLSYHLSLYDEGPASEFWKNETKDLFNSLLGIQGFYPFLILLTFIFFSNLKVGKFGESLNKEIPQKHTNILFTFLSISFLYFSFNAREMLGQGYLVDYDASKMGPLATVNLSSTLILLNILQWKKNDLLREKILFSSLILINSIFLLSMGGRMYVLCTLIAISLHFLNTSFSKKIHRFVLFILILAFSFLMVYIGIKRLSENISLLNFLNYAIAEPILSSITIGQLYECKKIPIIDFPSNYLSSFINFIPSGLFPSKSELVVNLSPDCINSPLGSTHIGASLLGNFGIIGSIFFIAIFSTFLRLVHNVNKNGWWLSYYIFSLIPFMFFRDGFSIFNKAFIFHGFIFCYIIVLFSRIKLK